jgi:hypothetical protein
MSHHSTIAHPQTDITDFYIFQKPGDSSKTIVIVNVNPDAPTKATTFDSAASYEVKIDTNGDAEAEIAIHITFSASTGGSQTANVYRASGDAARDTGALGERVIHDASVSFDDQIRITTDGAYRFYAGLRSDSWFVDLEGVLNNFQLTGRDYFADKNVFGIVLELPNDALGSNSRINVWARTVAPVDGELGQMDQVGRSLITPIFLTNEDDRHAFLHTPPAQQRARFLSKFVSYLTAAGYNEPEAMQLAMQLLPDTLSYDYTRAAGYPNGRNLTDDLLDIIIALSTCGKVTSDGIGAHTDLLDDFPYLGTPHQTAGVNS